MKKILFLMFFAQFSFGETYTYNQLLQSSMDTEKNIVLLDGDILDFENGYTVQIRVNDSKKFSNVKMSKKIDLMFSYIDNRKKSMSENEMKDILEEIQAELNYMLLTNSPVT